MRRIIDFAKGESVQVLFNDRDKVLEVLIENELGGTETYTNIDNTILWQLDPNLIYAIKLENTEGGRCKVKFSPLHSSIRRLRKMEYSDVIKVLSRGHYLIHLALNKDAEYHRMYLKYKELYPDFNKVGVYTYTQKCNYKPQAEQEEISVLPDKVNA